jgi:meiotically up-regulated gene 157 (Mug157) protein
MIWGGYRPSDDPQVGAAPGARLLPPAARLLQLCRTQALRAAPAAHPAHPPACRPLQTYGYNIPANMYAAAALEKALELNAHIWRSPYINGPAQQLLADIRAGIEAYGVVPVDGAPGQKMYAYEVDGLGRALKDFDDPNVPSLLSIPLLGYRHYDERVYQTTRARLLSDANPYYFKSDKVAGCGSPHTPHGFIWPLGLMVQVRLQLGVPGCLPARLPA